MTKLDIFLNSIELNDRASGTILLYKNNQIIYQRNFGSKIPKNSTPIYRLASISKIYTAVIILKLIEEGLLAFQTLVSDYFPEHENLKDMTIEHLLQHRSGIQNYTDRSDYWDYFEKGLSREEKLERIKGYSRNFSPGEKYSYSNTGFFLLSVIAEKITHQQFSEIINDKISMPLNLKNTYLVDSEHPRTNEVDSFAKGTSWIKIFNTHHSILLGSGGIVSTANELAIFLDSLMTEKIISFESLEKMKTMVDDYGYGLTTFPFLGKTFYGHNGSVDSFLTMAGYFPEDQLTYVMLTNASALDTNLISLAALSSFYNSEYTPPELKKDVFVACEELLKFEGDYKAHDFPLDFKFLVKNNSLYVHPKGQVLVPLEYFGDKVFEHIGLGVVIKFSDDCGQLQFTQNHLNYTYYKQ